MEAITASITDQVRVQHQLNSQDTKIRESNKPENTSVQAYADVTDTPDNRKAIESAIKALDIFQSNHPNTRFQYQVHAGTGSIQVALVNYLTGEVVEEIPSSKLLEFSSRMEELSGLVLEKKA